jgi:hypothetical protein
MGQYYKVVNLDKKEFIYPHAFGDGLKLMEFGCSSCGTMTALAVLLANSNGRGGGDLRSDNEIVGSWAGDRIVVAGDYAEPGDSCEGDSDPGASAEPNLYHRCHATGDFTDISPLVLEAISDDIYVYEQLRQAGAI